jgi:hypothetical protein
MNSFRWTNYVRKSRDGLYFRSMKDVARTERIRNTQNILLGKPQGKT